MLDKRIPYKEIIMKRPGTLPPLSPPVLPEGYSLRLFRAGDETHWARIETAVGEFEAPEKALAYFEKNYMPFAQELPRRMLFAIDPNGMPIGTASAWFTREDAGDQAMLHWVAVIPEAQGLGLGRAVVEGALCVAQELDKGRDIWLHTQTWSHKAVRLYYKLGFRMIKNARVVLSTRENAEPAGNDYDEAMAVLAQVEDEAFIRQLEETAE